MSKKLFVIVLPLLFLGCKENAPPEPPPYVRSIELEALDASCTEVWLKITLTQATTDSVVLTRNGQTLQTLRLTTADSILIDEGLLPNRSYLYKVYRLSGASVTDSSKAVQVTTMDTTSHNFTWQIDTLGDGGGSVLYDVAIINDTLAYAVGEIYKRDSLGNWDPLPYNLVKWNGQQWTLKRVTVMYRGSPITPPLNAIFAFSPTDIWLSSGVPIHGNGQNWTQYHLFDMGILTQNDGSINKIWGTGGSMYFVGNRGTIAHYDGASWRRIESGTTLPMNDVWGGDNKWLGNNVVLIAVSEKYVAGEKKLLIFRNSILDTLPWQMQDRRIHSVWFDQTSQVFTSGGGVFQSTGHGKWKEMSLPLIYTNRIRGNASNDLITVGDFGIVGHYNGVSWKIFNELHLPNGNYESVAIKGNLAIAVGWYGQSSRAVVVVGKR